MQNVASTLETSSHHFPLLFTPKRNHYFEFYHHRLILFILEIHIDGAIQYLLFEVWLLSLIIVRFIIFLHVALVHFYYVNAPEFIYSVNGWYIFAVFPLWGLINKAAVNILICVC